MDNSPAKKFVHLHVHSEYSLLDGSAKITELVARAKELSMDAIAITDHGVMFGAVDFYKEAVKQGVKPILGCEVYVSSGSRHNKESNGNNFYYHLVLLAENDEGYHNLIKLVSSGFKEGFYYRPRIDLEILRKYSKGLIALSACLSGPVAKTLLNVSYERARETALLYDDIFGRGNFYLELQDHGMAEQKRVNAELIRMSGEIGIPLVCTNDLHYINSDDAKAHEILLCIQTGKTIQDPDHMVYEGEQFYLKSADEMHALFKHVPEALENTCKIAERCNVEITFHEYKLPKYDAPGGMKSFEYLELLCRKGMAERYGVITDELETRLLYELDTIRKMGFEDYFLVVWDLIKFARDNGIMVGPGRGSGAGSIVNYSLKITNVDPIRCDLPFERFLNPERVSMPDIDTDFCYERRQEVIDYIVNKYGADHVTQIITFGTMAARGVTRDVGRAIGMPYGEVDKIAKMIPFALHMTIDRALHMNPDLYRVYSENEQVKYLLDMAQRLEGLPRHASTHAAGVVICDRPVDDYIPLNQNDGVITTQFPMNTVEELGLLKVDILGLRTLTVIRKAVDETKRLYGVDIDIDNIDFTDQKVYDMISQAKTEGVFQLESAGMKSFMKDLKPSSVDEIAAGIALYRPGPMESIPKYVSGKQAGGAVNYTHPSLEPILRKTYGCIVYQEDVIQIVRRLAGFSLARGDLIRRAMSKKKADVMARERENFINGLGDDVPGCVKNGIPANVAIKIWDEMTDFANYGFCKGHAAAYAVVVYQTAWLKYYYPMEYMAALMTSVMDWTPKVAEYIGECKKIGVTVRPPDVNQGFGQFTATENGVLFGLNAIKNVGRPAVAAIVAEREENGKFKSLTDFISRMDSKDINKRCIESLIKSGAFDSLGGRRSQYMENYERIMNGVSQTRKSSISGQLNLFDAVAPTDEDTRGFDDELQDIAEYPLRQLLNDEKEVLGIYVSGHPALEYEEVFKKYVNASSTDFISEDADGENGFGEGPKLTDGKEVAVGGIVSHKSVKYTKNNDVMAFVTIEDLYGEIELIVFPTLYAKHGHVLLPGEPLVAFGKTSVKEGEAGKVVCNDILPVKIENSQRRRELWLKISKDGKSPPYNDIMNLLSKFRGATPVVVYDEKTGEKRRVLENYWVNAENEFLLNSLKRILGEKSVAMK